jgi:hypothetical protein
MEPRSIRKSGLACGASARCRWRVLAVGGPAALPCGRTSTRRDGGGRRESTARRGRRPTRADRALGRPAGADGGGGRPASMARRGSRRGATVGRAAGAGGDGGGRTAERGIERERKRERTEDKTRTRFLIFNFRRPRQVAAEISAIFGGYLIYRRN